MIVAEGDELIRIEQVVERSGPFTPFATGRVRIRWRGRQDGSL
jgi:hypothetical protein